MSYRVLRQHILRFGYVRIKRRNESVINISKETKSSVAEASVRKYGFSFSPHTCFSVASIGSSLHEPNDTAMQANIVYKNIFFILFYYFQVITLSLIIISITRILFQLRVAIQSRLWNREDILMTVCFIWICIFTEP